MKRNYDRMQETLEREGDPEDDHLNQVEKSMIWPRMVDNRVKNVVCKSECDAIEECMKKYGLALSFMCLFDKFFYARCVSKHRGSEDVKDDCLEEYLALRSKYRLTKDPETLNRMKAMVFPSQHSDESQPQ